MGLFFLLLMVYYVNALILRMTQHEENAKKGIQRPVPSNQNANSGGGGSGNLRRIPNKKTKFVSPLITNRSNGKEDDKVPTGSEKTVVEDERLKNIDPQMVETIRNEIMDQSTPVAW